MAVINSALASAISRVAAAQEAKATSSTTQSATDSFGPASTVTLSAAAQSALGSTSSDSGTSAPSAAAGGGGGTGVPISTSSSTSTDTELLVEEADQEVIPKVGVQGASEVVDSKGDIDEVKLNELILQQDQAAQGANQAA